MQRGESPLCGLGRGFSAVWKGRIRGRVRPICCVRFGFPFRFASAAGWPIGSWRGEGSGGRGWRSVVWARTGATVWCQAETGGMEDKRNGAPGPVRLRGSVVESFPLSGAGCGSRPGCSERSSGAGVDKVPGSPPARRPVVLSSCRLVVLSPRRPAVLPYPPTVFFAPLPWCVSFRREPWRRADLRPWQLRPAPEWRAEAVRGPGSCATLLAASFRREP